MSLRDGVWRLWRDGEPFALRFTGRFSDDDATIAGRWELAEDGAAWRTDSTSRSGGLAEPAQLRGRSRSREGCTRFGSPGIFG